MITDLVGYVISMGSISFKQVWRIIKIHSSLTDISSFIQLFKKEIKTSLPRRNRYKVQNKLIKESFSSPLKITIRDFERH